MSEDAVRYSVRHEGRMVNLAAASAASHSLLVLVEARLNLAKQIVNALLEDAAAPSGAGECRAMGRPHDR